MNPGLLLDTVGLRKGSWTQVIKFFIRSAVGK